MTIYWYVAFISVGFLYVVSVSSLPEAYTIDLKVRDQFPEDLVTDWMVQGVVSTCALTNIVKLPINICYDLSR